MRSVLISYGLAVVVIVLRCSLGGEPSYVSIMPISSAERGAPGTWMWTVDACHFHSTMRRINASFSSAFFRAVSTTASLSMATKECEGGKLPIVRGGLGGAKTMVQLIATMFSERLTPLTGVRVYEIEELLPSLVSVLRWIHWRAHQREPQHVADSIIAVLGLVHQRNTIGIVAQISITLSSCRRIR